MRRKNSNHRRGWGRSNRLAIFQIRSRRFSPRGSSALLGLTRTLESLLFGVTPTDPLTFTLVIAVLAAVAAMACYVPARRAMRGDPAEALRQE